MARTMLDPNQQAGGSSPATETYVKAIKPLLLGVSILALASGAAYAAGDTKNKSAQRMAGQCMP